MDFSLIFCGFLCMVVVGVLLPWWCLWLWWQRWVLFVWIFDVGGGMAMSFSLGMLFVVVVVVADLGCFYLGFDIYYFIM